MNEKEKKAVETVKGLAVYYADYSLLDQEEIEENENVNKSIELISNLIEKLQKENEEWQRAYQEEKDRQFNLIRKSQKKDKIIDLMAEKIFEEGIVWENKEEVKQYFKNKAKEILNK